MTGPHGFGIPGYWTALMREHNWPRGFFPQSEWGKNEVKHKEAAARGRQTMLDKGETGTVHGMGSERADLARVHSGELRRQGHTSFRCDGCNNVRSLNGSRLAAAQAREELRGGE